MYTCFKHVHLTSITTNFYLPYNLSILQIIYNYPTILSIIPSQCHQAILHAYRVTVSNDDCNLFTAFNNLAGLYASNPPQCNQVILPFLWDAISSKLFK